jgi:hypothetical protein
MVKMLKQVIARLEEGLMKRVKIAYIEKIFHFKKLSGKPSKHG